MGCFQSTPPEAAVADGRPTSQPPAAISNINAPISEPTAGVAAAAASAAATDTAGGGVSKGKMASFGSGGITSVGEAPPAVKKPDPKDYMFSNQKNKLLIKQPGSIDGQMFIIEDSEDCDMYVCDRTATVTVDYCNNCRIFIAPSESSVFIRNCNGCRIIVACQQLRTRDCKDCDILLYCNSAPVIEESTNMRFGCFKFSYFSLKSQFDAAKLSVWDNQWSSIYDFTPGDTPHYTFLPIETNAVDIMKPVALVAEWAGSEPPMRDDEIVPTTYGKRPKLPHPSIFVLSHPNEDENMKPFLIACSESGFTTIQTSLIDLTKQKSDALFAKAGGTPSAFAKGGKCVAVEICGPDAFNSIPSIATKTIESKCYVSASPESAQHEIQTCFEQWKESAGRPIH